MATKRNGAGGQATETIPQPAETTADKYQKSNYHAPIPPSPYYLLIYPTILLLGSTFAVISPTATSRQDYTHATAMAPGLSADMSTPTNPPPPINYFASKRNVLNIYFVKQLWLWTTIAFTLILSMTHVLPLLKPTQGPSPLRLKLLAQSCLRYFLITLAWYFTTQWCFGPPLIDRSFTLSGGHCHMNAEFAASLSPGKEILTSTFSTACKRHGGTWTGGHDISGHVFLLVLSTSFLLLELWLSDRHQSSSSTTSSSSSAYPHITPEAAAGIANSTTAEEKAQIGGWDAPSSTSPSSSSTSSGSTLETTARTWIRRFVWTIVALGFWMLLMTSVWFHRLSEKLSGLGLAAAVIYGVFWAGRLHEGWKAVIGGV